VWFPLLQPKLASTSFSDGAAATAFLGGTIFEVGSYLMVVEALDRGREIQFGTALGELLHRHRQMETSHNRNELEQMFHKTGHLNLHSDRARRSDDESDSSRTAVGPATGGESESAPGIGADLNALRAAGSRMIHCGSGRRGLRGAKGWVWWGKPLWHDMGYLASLMQLCAASVFWIATLTGLPGVIPGLYTDSASVAIEDVFYWTPQVIGGSGFIISSTILMLEVQTKWWKPNLLDIGWQIAFWNLVGSIGFTLCGALGYSTASGAVYQSVMSTFWGSWAFLIGSVIQVGESVWREEAPKDAGAGENNEKRT